MLESNRNIIVNSRKFDGQIHRSWKADLIEQDDSKFFLVGKFEKEIIHPLLGIIRPGTVSYEFYWFNCYYNVFRFHEPDGKLRNFYCNINLPPKFENGVLDYIDLDIDVVVWNDFGYQILDLQEFEENAAKFSYDQSLMNTVETNLKKLIFIIENRHFPFDYQI